MTKRIPAKKESFKTCADCRRRRKCMERSREYPCIQFKPLNQSEMNKTAR